MNKGMVEAGQKNEYVTGRSDLEVSGGVEWKKVKFLSQGRLRCFLDVRKEVYKKISGLFVPRSR